MMGQRFTLDEYVFGQLIWRNVGDPNGGDEDKRWLPKGLDVPAALGSEEATRYWTGWARRSSCTTRSRCRR